MSDPKPRRRPAIEPRLLNVTEAGRALSISARKMRELIDAGELESVTIGERPKPGGGTAAGRRLVPVDALDAYVARLRAEQTNGNGHRVPAKAAPKRPARRRRSDA